MATNITSKTGRAALLPRREPYWARVRTGLFVGYRRMKDGEGTWIARLQEHNKKQYRSLGSISADKAFDKASAAAIEWSDSLQVGISNKVVSVEDVCRTYVEHLKLKNSTASSSDADGRFKRLVYGKKIAKIELSKLTTTVVRKWLNDQVILDEDEETLRKSKDSANRNLSSLKAALNLALSDRLVAHDAGWKTVTSFPEVGRRRTEYLDEKQRKSLIDACPEDLKQLVKAMLLTAARPGDLAELVVSDFSKEQGTLELGHKTKRRTVTISTAAWKFFSSQAKGKLPNAALLQRSDGQSWKKDAWKKVFKETVIEAKLPLKTVIYTLRHVAISELISGGMDSFIVAKLARTSVAMIEKHYGYLRHQSTRPKLDKIKLI